MTHQMDILDALDGVLTPQLEREKFQQVRTPGSLVYYRHGSRTRGDMIALQVSPEGPPMIKGVIRSHQSEQELGLGCFVVEQGADPPLGWAILEATWRGVVTQICDVIRGQVLPWLEEPHPRVVPDAHTTLPRLKLLKTHCND